MCTSIHVKGMQGVIGTVDELAKLVGLHAIIIEDGYHSDDPREFFGGCLCPVNVPDTLIEAGYRVWASDGDSMRYVCDRTETAQKQPTPTETNVNESATNGGQ